MRMKANHAKVALAATLVLATGSAFAGQSKDIVATAYGGVWQKSVEKSFVPCYEKSTGGKVHILTGESSDWLNRVRAQPNNPPIDALTLSGLDTLRAAKEGLLQKLTVKKVPNLKHIPKKFYKPWGSYGVVENYGAMGVMYNNNAIHNPPKTWAGLIKAIASGKYGDKVAWPSVTYTWGAPFLWFMSQQYDGKISTAFQKMKAIQPHVLKFWTTPVGALNLFATRQVNLLVYWDGRAFNFINKGNKWASFYIPSHKTIAGSVLISKPKNSNPASWKYLNCALDAAAQTKFAAGIHYAVSNRNVKYPSSLKGQVTTADEVVIPPFKKIVTNIQNWTNKWNQEMR